MMNLSLTAGLFLAAGAHAQNMSANATATANANTTAAANGTVDSLNSTSLNTTTTNGSTPTLNGTAGLNGTTLNATSRVTDLRPFMPDLPGEDCATREVKYTCGVPSNYYYPAAAHIALFGEALCDALETNNVAALRNETQRWDIAPQNSTQWAESGVSFNATHMALVGDKMKARYVFSAYSSVEAARGNATANATGNATANATANATISAPTNATISAPTNATATGNATAPANATATGNATANSTDNAPASATADATKPARWYGCRNAVASLFDNCFVGSTAPGGYIYTVGTWEDGTESYRIAIDYLDIAAAFDAPTTTNKNETAEAYRSDLMPPANETVTETITQAIDFQCKTPEEAAKAREEAKKKEEEERKKKEEEEKKKAEEEKKKKQEEARKKAEEAKKKADDARKQADDAKAKAEEAQKQADEAKKNAEAEAEAKNNARDEEPRRYVPPQAANRVPLP